MIADSDEFAKCTTKDEVIACYLAHLNELKEIAEQKYAIDSDEFIELFKNELLNEQQLSTTPIPTTTATHSEQMVGKHDLSQCIDVKYVYGQLRRYAYYIAMVAVICVLINYRSELSRLFMRNIQVYIYPGMRFWRKLTLPIIRQFPQLTELYDETCLVSNPFFRVANLDCTPCAGVINVVDLTMVPHFDYLGNNIPHIIKQVDKNKNDSFHLFSNHLLILYSNKFIKYRPTPV